VLREIDSQLRMCR